MYAVTSQLAHEGDRVSFFVENPGNTVTGTKNPARSGSYSPQHADLADFLYLHKDKLDKKITSAEFKKLLAYSKKRDSDYLTFRFSEIPEELVGRIIPPFLEFFVSRVVQEEHIGNIGASPSGLYSSSTVLIDDKSDPTSLVRILSRAQKGSLISFVDPITGKTTLSNVYVSEVDTSNGKVGEVESKLITEHTEAIRRIKDRHEHSVREVLERLRKRIDEAKSAVYMDVYRDLTRIQSSGWVILEKGIRGWNFPVVQYPEKIVPTHLSVDLYAITKRAIDKGKVVRVELPKKLSKRMHVYEVTVPLADTIKDGMCKGIYPHMHGSGDSFCHLCIGDSGGRPIRNLPDLASSLETINYGSMYSNDSVSWVGSFVDDLRSTFSDKGEIPGVIRKDGTALTTTAGTLFHTGTAFSSVSIPEPVGTDHEEDEGDW